MARIRLGYTYVIHSYLLKGEDQPECAGCACPVPVQHIMIDCVDFAHIRSLFVDVGSMKKLSIVTPSTILLYVMAIGLFLQDVA